MAERKFVTDAADPEYGDFLRGEMLKNRENATEAELRELKLKDGWTEKAPESMQGPAIVPQTPMPNSFGSEWEATKKLREDLTQLKKLVNNVALHIQPVFGCHQTGKDASEAQSQLDAAVEDITLFSEASLPKEGEYKHRVTQVAQIVDEAKKVPTMDQAGYDNFQERLRRDQQQIFLDVKKLLAVMKDQKKVYLASQAK